MAAIYTSADIANSLMAQSAEFVTEQRVEYFRRVQPLDLDALFTAQTNDL